MRFTLLLLITTVGFLFDNHCLLAQKGTKKEIIGYLPNWTAYKRQKLINPANIDYSKYTILTYSFFSPDKEGKITSCDAYADKFLLGAEPNVVDLAHKNGVKVMVSIGGWTLSKNFSGIAADSLKRKIFAKECVRILEENKFDGIDIDWEWPTSKRVGGRPEDTKNFTLLLKDIRVAIDEYGKAVEQEMLLTAAMGAAAEHFEAINWADICPVLDYINLMTYSYYGTFSKKAFHNSPLYLPKDTLGDCTDRSVHLLLDKYKVPLNKLNVGLSFYGKAMLFPEGKAALASNEHLHLADTTGLFSKSKGSPTYYDMLDIKSNYDQYWDDVSKVPYLISKNKATLICYDDEQSIKIKAQYVNDMNASGVIIWDITSDYVETEPSSGQIKSTPLATVLAETLHHNPKSLKVIPTRKNLK